MAQATHMLLLSSLRHGMIQEKIGRGEATKRMRAPISH